ncbi:hypothetical protein [Pseudomonas syringae]|uniref:Uncharacterized protein n=1 Tax=Pseudomonas syringae TaxID=317 RepID=A0A085V6Q4_PSESX|nr:hypothetical protein [Pseudomonas syringae]KFE51117.1 hypothetical protein IV02_14005 [Pseudomonas syringae]
MSKYAELTSHYNEVAHANEVYWDELRQMIKRVKADFSTYLGVGSEPIMVGGRQQPAVTVGKMDEDGDLLKWSVDALPKLGNGIEFALCLGFASSAASEPGPAFTYNLTITKSPAGFLVRPVEGAGDGFIGPTFEELFEYLIKRTAEAITGSRRR